VHLVGFIANKFVTVHGHTNVKLQKLSSSIVWSQLRNDCSVICACDMSGILQ